MAPMESPPWGAVMRRLVLLLMLAVIAWPAQAKPLRYPSAGAYRFNVDLPEGWRTTTDRRGGLVLVPPDNHSLIYLSIISEAKWRGRSDSAVVQAVGGIAGIVMTERHESERITAADGARIIRGTAYYGTLPSKHGLARRARIVLFKLAPDTWAQVWTVTQPGMNARETAALGNVLNSITLSSQ